MVMNGDAVPDRLLLLGYRVSTSIESSQTGSVISLSRDNPTKISEVVARLESESAPRYSYTPKNEMFEIPVSSKLASAALDEIVVLVAPKPIDSLTSRITQVVFPNAQGDAVHEGYGVGLLHKNGSVFTVVEYEIVSSHAGSLVDAVVDWKIEPNSEMYIGVALRKTDSRLMLKQSSNRVTTLSRADASQDPARLIELVGAPGTTGELVVGWDYEARTAGKTGEQILLRAEESSPTIEEYLDDHITSIEAGVKESTGASANLTIDMDEMTSDYVEFSAAASGSTLVIANIDDMTTRDIQVVVERAASAPLSFAPDFRFVTAETPNYDVDLISAPTVIYLRVLIRKGVPIVTQVQRFETV
jgi:hypothetical protein